MLCCSQVATSQHPGANTVPMHHPARISVGLVRYDPHVTIEAAEWVRVESDTPGPVQVDGEILGVLPAMVKLHSERLQLMFPRDP